MCQKPDHHTSIRVSVGDQSSEGDIPLNRHNSHPTAQEIWRLLLSLELPVSGSLQVSLVPFCASCSGIAGVPTMAITRLELIPQKQRGRALWKFCRDAAASYIQTVRDSAKLIRAADERLRSDPVMQFGSPKGDPWWN